MRDMMGDVDKEGYRYVNRSKNVVNRLTGVRMCKKRWMLSLRIAKVGTGRRQRGSWTLYTFLGFTKPILQVGFRTTTT